MRCLHRTYIRNKTKICFIYRQYRCSSYGADGYIILVWYDFIIHSFVNLHKKIDEKFISYKILQKNKKKSLILS